MRREGIDRRQRASTLLFAVAIAACCLLLARSLSGEPAFASSTAAGKHHPTPQPTPTTTLTPTPTPTPRPTPKPTPQPTPRPTPAATRAPLPRATPRPIAVSVAASASADASTLTNTGQGLPTDSPQALLITPTPENAIATDPGNGSGDQSFFLVLVALFIGIPGFILMALVATVLIRR